MADVDVSLIVCTRNRLESLKATIASFDRLTVPQGWSTELIVVDSGSTDGTADYLSEARCKIPIRPVAMAEPGKSLACNAGMANARGKVFLWTDDDVIPDPDWLWKMVKPILDAHADAVAGMVVIPAELRRLANGTPFEHRMGYLAATEWSNWEKPPRMVGASMAFGAHVLEKVPRFDERLGPGPTSLGLNDETLFCAQLLDAGYRLVGAPDAIVHHHFDPSRLDPTSMFRKAAKTMGGSDAYVDWHWHHTPVRRFIWLEKVIEIVKRRRANYFANAGGRLENEFSLARRLAYLDEYQRCMKEPRKYRRNHPFAG